MNVKKLKKNIEKYKKLIDQVDKLYDEICTQLMELLKVISPDKKYKVDGYEWPYITIYEDSDEWGKDYEDDKKPVFLESVLEEYGIKGAYNIISVSPNLSDEELKRLKEVMDES